MKNLLNLRQAWLAIPLLLASCGPADTENTTTLSVNGLREPVEILRDNWGVNHLYARNEHDLFFAQGYAAAKDRLFQFEIWRRRATGTVAEILGPAELERDIGARLFRYRGDMTAELNHYHPRGEAIINAYVDGVNAWIDEVLQNPDLLPMEFQILGIQPGKWTPDVVVSRHQGLLGNINEELSIGMAVARAGEKVVKDLIWFHPHEPDLTLDTAIRGDLLAPEILALYNAFRGNLAFKPEHLVNLEDTVEWIQRLNRYDAPPTTPAERGTEGSNNWVVAASKSQSGYPLMANDPHRAITVPSLRYMVHLNAPGWDVIGGGEPVIPGISIGHNGYGAWGLTIHKTDSEDLYVYHLNPRNLNQYRYKDEWVDMKEIRETIPVKGRPAHAATLRYTVHGPVTYIDSVNHKAYAVRCGWLEPGGAPYLASLRMNQAQTWEEFREACTYSHIPGENMVWADREGNIGWQVVGILPARNNFSGMVPIPGDGRYEWDGYVPIENRPHLFNVEKGFLATANEYVTPKDYPLKKSIGYTWSDPYRGKRINEVLSESQKFGIEDMQRLQTDYLSIPARTLVPFLKDLRISDHFTDDARQQLLNWNYRLDPSSVPAGIYVMWERKILEVAEKRFVPAELLGLVNLQLHRVIEWIAVPGNRFGPVAPERNRDAFLRETFDAAIAELRKKLGDSMDQWQYGQARYKHAMLTNTVPSMSAVGLRPKIDLGPVPRGGNGHTPNATGGADRQTHGASFRIIVDLSDWDKTKMINTPGQSADPASAYYDNLFELWSRDEYFPAYYSKEKVKGVTEERYVLAP